MSYFLSLFVCLLFFCFAVLLSSEDCSPHASPSLNARTVEESFSDDDSAFFKQHGAYLHDEKILELHMSAADTRVSRRARKLIMYVAFTYSST